MYDNNDITYKKNITVIEDGLVVNYYITEDIFLEKFKSKQNLNTLMKKMKSDPRQMISQNTPEYQLSFISLVNENNLILKFRHYLIKKNKDEILINEFIIFDDEW